MRKVKAMRTRVKKVQDRIMPHDGDILLQQRRQNTMQPSGSGSRLLLSILDDVFTLGPDRWVRLNSPHALGFVCSRSRGELCGRKIQLIASYVYTV